MDNLFLEGFVKVIVNIIRNIVSFDNLKYYKHFPQEKKQSQGKRSLTKLRSSLKLLKLYFLVFLFTRSTPLMFIKTYLSPSYLMRKKFL